MLFNSYAFVVLVGVTFALFYAPALRRYQTGILIAASLVFFAWHVPVQLLLLLASIFVNATTSYAVAWNEDRRAKRAWATFGVVGNLVVLAFFKYGPLIARSFWPDPGSDPVGAFLVSLPLPIGISFFTFEGISLLVDTWRGVEDPARPRLVERGFGRHLRNTTLFVSFFPHLISGPILKAHQFLPQIAPKTLAAIRWENVFRAVVLGYFLKMVVADNLKDLTSILTYPYFEAYSSSTLLVLLFGYSMQIFADFAGYSLIAIGVAALFGYELIENFHFPYVARSFSDFWRRWHISLSTWLRDYLYIPLGGSRRGEARTYLNLMIVMFLGGLWHGAAWSFALWGTFHGVALAVERALAGRFRPRDTPVVQALQMMLVFSLVTLAWLLFKLQDITHVWAFFETLGRNAAQGVAFGRTEFAVVLFSLPVVFYHLQSLVTRVEVRLQLWRWFEAPVYAMLLLLILLNSGPPGEFIYFQF